MNVQYECESVWVSNNAENKSDADKFNEIKGWDGGGGEDNRNRGMCEGGEGKREGKERGRGKEGEGYEWGRVSCGRTVQDYNIKLTSRYYVYSRGYQQFQTCVRKGQ